MCQNYKDVCWIISEGIWINIKKNWNDSDGIRWNIFEGINLIGSWLDNVANVWTTHSSVLQLYWKFETNWMKYIFKDFTFNDNWSQQIIRWWICNNISLIWILSLFYFILFWFWFFKYDLVIFFILIKLQK